MTKQEANELLLNADFTYAKSMPEIPHWYTLRETWDDREFIEVVQFIRANGVREWFYRKRYTYYYLNGYKYWTMGSPLHNSGKTGTILINKAPADYPANYDSIAHVYDTLFTDEEKIEEDKEVIEMATPSGAVLDIGCGTGLFLDYTGWEDYIGIDPSIKMIQKLKEKHIDAEAYACPFSDFHAPRKIDTIIGLYGVASYLTEDDMEAILHSSASRVFLMGYAKDYFPETYQKTRIDGVRTLKSGKGYKVSDYHNYVIYER